MAGKKKATRRAKVATTAAKPARKAKAKAKRGPKPGTKYTRRSKKDAKVYRVLDINGVVTLGIFTNLDAAHDAIAAQLKLHSESGDKMAGVEHGTIATPNSFTWTIILTRAGDLSVPADLW